jgi:fimbrial chaperone protein
VSRQGDNVRKTATTIRGLLAGCVLFAAGALSASAQAGVALGATRVIYPAGQKQVQLAVTNNDDNSTWLIQSWVENADGSETAGLSSLPAVCHAGQKREYPAHYRCDQ